MSRLSRFIVVSLVGVTFACAWISFMPWEKHLYTIILMYALMFVVAIVLPGDKKPE